MFYRGFTATQDMIQQDPNVMSRINQLNFFSVLKSHLPTYTNRNSKYEPEHLRYLGCNSAKRAKKAIDVYTQVCPLSAKTMHLKLCT